MYLPQTERWEPAALFGRPRGAALCGRACPPCGGVLRLPRRRAATALCGRPFRFGLTNPDLVGNEAEEAGKEEEEEEEEEEEDKDNEDSAGENE